MTRHKTLSSLSIGAATILFAAIPCFAQTRQDESRAATGTPASANIIQPALAMNRDLAPRKAIASTAADEKTTRANQPSLSREMFQQSASQFSAGAGERLITQNTFEPRADISKQQFSLDDYNGPAPRPRVTFVASHGQKLPN